MRGKRRHTRSAGMVGGVGRHRGERGGSRRDEEGEREGKGAGVEGGECGGKAKRQVSGECESSFAFGCQLSSSRHFPLSAASYARSIEGDGDHN